MRPTATAKRDNLLLSQIAAGLLIFTIAAFAAKALLHTEVHARYTPIVLLHALAMLGWLALLSGQAWLAANQTMRLHRTLGHLSIILVAVMTVSGAIIAINIGEELGRPEVAVVNLAAFATFLPLYFAALYFARHRNLRAHRQAILIATLALMTPAYARVVQVLGLPDPVAIAVQVPITIVIAVGYDWATERKVSHHVLWMLGFSVAVIAVMVAVLAVWFL